MNAYLLLSCIYRTLDCSKSIIQINGSSKHFGGVQALITLKCLSLYSIICDAHKVKSCHVFKLSFEPSINIHRSLSTRFKWHRAHEQAREMHRWAYTENSWSCVGSSFVRTEYTYTHCNLLIKHMGQGNKGNSVFLFFISSDIRPLFIFFLVRRSFCARDWLLYSCCYCDLFPCSFFFISILLITSDLMKIGICNLEIEKRVKFVYIYYNFLLLLIKH